MSFRDEVLSTRDAAHILGVSERRVQQLATSGELTFAGRGLVDRNTLSHHLATHQGSRSRAWSQPTSWAALALLNGVEAGWLGSTQLSRLRGSLRSIDAAALVSRTRNRARTHRYAGHNSTAARLIDEVLPIHIASMLGIVGEVGLFDAYIASRSLDDLVRRHALIEDTRGGYILRGTDFDLDVVATIASRGEIPVLAALDSAESLDPRQRGVGLETLELALARFRG